MLVVDGCALIFVGAFVVDLKGVVFDVGALRVVGCDECLLVIARCGFGTVRRRACIGCLLVFGGGQVFFELFQAALFFLFLQSFAVRSHRFVS